MEASNELLSIGKTAKYMKVSISTIRRWDARGKLKSVRHPMNNYRMYWVKDLDKILNKLRNK